ncbi:MAG: DUF502 domain-containing protein [Syntrophomonas sp.]|uniref:DUF502 domain-containing protein n=1 Tax=Syntrophomonas sp. TaxID=2053627 RepID=UPI002615E78B|nr:DUF502 domain-containing protein [Syntrophomonas sp.]MDD2509967.1 DUF502 domain-containing protein [Syntrophomonas sp.]MDD3878768.1 DUF502 domain-containing protein [Syntrophomonas sp.]MDD4626668.1 DUF502 domain-containing protein [Syntrophomonas sp.]
MNRLARYFINGLLFIVPIFLTFYIIYILFLKIDSLLQIPLPGIGIIPGVGFVATLLIITLTGVLVSNLITRRFMSLMDRLFNRLPLVKILYSSIKDLINAFLGEKKTFNKPVLVTIIPGSNASALGFVTSDSLEHLGLVDMVAVYFPQSYNFAGNLLLFPREQVRPIGASSSDVMTFIVSGGVAKS